MKMNDVVAVNIRLARKTMGWNQAELAERMHQAGASWSRMIVGTAEGGQRNITVDELAALSVVFSTTPGYWLAPETEAFGEADPTVEAGAGALSGTWLVAAAAAGDAAPSDQGEFSAWARFHEVMAQVIRREGVSGKNARLLHQTLSRLRAVTIV